MYIFLIVLVFFLLAERFFQAIKYEKVPSWVGRALFINILTVTCVQVFDTWWNKTIPGMSVVQISEIAPAPLAGLIGFMWATLAVYWWHRAMHESDFLWRTLHQLHHSPRRIEILATFYTHPLNAISVSFISSLMIHFIGLNTEAIWWFGLIYAVISLFNHANINAPRWIGYVIQTPNMHRIHHEYQKHRNNYCEFVLWDVLFGTYQNPGTNPKRCGFDMEKEVRIGAMLLGKDVHKE